MKKYNQSLDALRKGFAIRQLMGEKLGSAKVRLNMAQVFLETAALDSGLIAIEESVEVFDSLHSAADLQEAYSIKAGLLYRKNDFASAFKALQQHLIWKDTMNRQTSDKQAQQQVMLLKMNYTDSLTLARKQEIQQLRKQRNFFIIISVITLLGSLGLTVYLLAYSRNRLTPLAESRIKTLEFELEGARRHLKSQAQVDMDALRDRLNSLDAWQESYWNEFLLAFSHVYPTFFSRVRNGYPDLTPHELRICALVKMNLSLDEMGEILGISGESVRKARYRIYKKMGLGSDQELIDTLFSD